MKREGEAWPKAKGACTFVLGTLLVKLYSGNGPCHMSASTSGCLCIFLSLLEKKLWNCDRCIRR